MSNARRPELDFLHSWAVVLPTFKSEESLGYKFGSVKAFIKRLTCVNQKCLLRSLVMQLVVKLLEPTWTSGFRWRRFFQSPQIHEQNTQKYFLQFIAFSLYMSRADYLTMSININFSFILNEKFVFSGFERLVNIVPETINNDNNNNDFNSFDENTYQKLQRWRTSY